MRRAGFITLLPFVLSSVLASHAPPLARPDSPRTFVAAAIGAARELSERALARALGPDRDYLTLAGTSLCFNHDLRFGTCSAVASGWDLSDGRVAHGADCLARGRLPWSLALRRCADRAADAQLMRAANGRLCADAACRRCLSPATTLPGTRLADACASISVRRARAWAHARGAAVVALLGAAVVALWLAWRSSARGARRPPSADACARADALLAALFADPSLAGADGALRQHVVGTRARLGHYRAEFLGALLVELLAVERAAGAALRALAERAPPRSAARALFAARAGASDACAHGLRALADSFECGCDGLGGGGGGGVTAALVAHWAAFGASLDPAAAACALERLAAPLAELGARLACALELHCNVARAAALSVRAAGGCGGAMEALTREVLGAALERGRCAEDALARARAHADAVVDFWRGASVGFGGGVAAWEHEVPPLRGSVRRAPLPDGGELVYVDTAGGGAAGAARPGGGATLVLLHGWPDSLDTWRVLACHLDPAVRLISLNLHGRAHAAAQAAAPAPGAEPNSLERMTTAETDAALGADADGAPAAAAAATAAVAADGTSGWQWLPQLLRGPRPTAVAVSTAPADLPVSRSASLAKQPRSGIAASAPAAALSVEQLAADVLCVLRHAQVSKVSLCGYSLGALVARALAAGCVDEVGSLGLPPSPPLEVEWLFLMSTAPTGARNHVAKKLLPLFRDSTLQIDAQFVGVWQARVVHSHGALPEWFARLLRERSLQLPKAVWAAGLEAMANDNLFAELGRIRARVRLLLGAEDRLNPRVDAEAISAALRSAADRELVAIEGAGCVPHWDAPEAVAREINKALAPDGDACKS